MTLSTSATPVSLDFPRLASRAQASDAGGAVRGGRIDYAETIRGLTCIFVVLYHAIGNDPAHGLHAEPGSFWWLTARILDLIDMPLFAFVSGRVFGIPTGDGGRYASALMRKVVRLGVPLITVTTLFLIVSRVSGHGAQTTPWLAYVTPYEHLWYLQASLCLMLTAAIGFGVFANHRMAFAVLAAVIATIAYLSIPVTASVFSWRNAVSLAPFYFLGVLLGSASRSGLIGFEGRADRLDTVIFGTFMAIGVLALWATETPFGEELEQYRARLLIGISFVLLLATHAPRSTLLAKVAERSYTIYLFHVFLMAPMRMVVVQIWPGAPASVLLVASVGVALGLPWLLHDLIARHPLTAFLFQGVTPPRVTTAPAGAPA